MLLLVLEAAKNNREPLKIYTWLRFFRISSLYRARLWLHPVSISLINSGDFGISLINSKVSDACKLNPWIPARKRGRRIPDLAIAAMMPWRRVKATNCTFKYPQDMIHKTGQNQALIPEVLKEISGIEDRFFIMKCGSPGKWACWMMNGVYF